jgi:hypothetical protein
MKIIKKGRKCKAKYYYGICPKCKCEFSCENLDIDKNGKNYYCFCPNNNCETDVIVYSKKQYIK